MRVVAFEGARFGLTETAWVTSRFREALLSKLPSGNATPELLSGHGAGGRPSTRPHLAFAPLANVSDQAGKFSDGAIKGIALLLPRELDERSLLLLDTAVARVDRLVFGARGELRVQPRRALYSLETRRYTRSATTWITATPIVLGWHPKPGRGLSEDDIVVRHLRDLGLPEPSSVRLHDVSDLWGAPRARDFHRGKISALAGRQLRHAVIRFRERVVGPLVVGAGAHMGFGLLLSQGELS